MITKLKKARLRDYGVVIGFLVLCAVIAIVEPAFLRERNLMNLLRQSSIIGIIACGMTAVIISGNFDISVGAMAAIAGATIMKLMAGGVPFAVGLLAVLGIGALVGLVNGAIVSVIRVPALIATMGMTTILKGLTLYITGGYPISGSYPTMEMIGMGYFLRIPNPVIFYAFAVLAMYFILNKTAYGRHIYSVGGNAEASRMSGIKTTRVVISVFVLNSILAGIAGIVLAGRLGTATPIAGDGYDMDAIAATVIGGTSVAGGEGSVLKTVIGVLLMSVISNAFNLLGIDIYMQYVIRGLIIVLAVSFDSLSRRKTN